MELKDFVAETLKQIIEGVKNAQDYAQESGGQINPQWSSGKSGESVMVARRIFPIKEVEFDVAVTAAEGTKTKGGIGIFVGPVGLGSHGQSDASSSSISKIKFSVPMVLPWSLE
jgi:hypothetical protein